MVDTENSSYSWAALLRLTLVFTLAVGIAIAAMLLHAECAFAEESETSVLASSATGDWDPSLMSLTTSAYCGDLARVCAQLSLVSEETTDDNIRAKLREYGFSPETYNYGGDSAFAIASRTENIGGEATEVIVVVARGTKTATEGIGDVFKGWAWDKTREHCGRWVYSNVHDFYNIVYAELGSYIESHESDLRGKNVKVVVTGHSLGGACANLLAAALDNGYFNGYFEKANVKSKPSKSDIYAYTFGAIKVLEDGSAAAEDGYENIHNVYNYYDSYGPNGELSHLNASNPGQYFGHTEMFNKVGPYVTGEDYIDLTDCPDHGMEAYIKGLDGISSFGCVAKSFPDVSSSAWYYNAVSRASGVGYITGYSDGRFGPADRLTRGQAAVILCRYLGGSASGSINTTGMADVEVNRYYTAAANWAVKNGVMSGKSAADGSRYFDPDGALTRQELCAIVANAAKKYAGSSTGYKYVVEPVDVQDFGKVSDWAVSSVKWALECGLISGTDKGGKRYASPADPVNRAQMAAIIMNVHDNNLLGKRTSVGTSIAVGDTVLFGRYEQDNSGSDGKEAIEWRVLAKSGGKALLVSKYGLDAKPYNTAYTSVTWETCTLRKWLNSTFLSSALTSSEKATVQTATLSNPSNAQYGTLGGNATSDKAFLLSTDEVNKYLSSASDRVCSCTAYAMARGARQGEPYTGWWLRSPGFNSCYALIVDNYYGSVDGGGGFVNLDYLAVRPALWVNLS